MKVLFLNPPSFSRFDSAGARFAAVRKTASLWYPVWLGYAASLVSKSKLIDCPAASTTIKDLKKIVKKYNLVVIYTSTPSFNNDTKVAKMIKKANPKSKIIFTGPHVSVLPEETLKSSNYIEAVARKEFDYTIFELSKKKPWSQIKGLSYKKGKKIIHNPDRPLLKNLDKLPFVSRIYKRDLPIKNYHLPFCLHPYLAIYASRGCPNLCTFCLWPQTFTGRVYRKRSVDSVIKEVSWIKKNIPAIKEIFFDDDTFTINDKWLNEFCLKIQPLKIVWSVNARADLSFTLMEKMKKAGLRLMVVGFESGSDKILRNIKKGVTTWQMKKFARNAKKADLMLHGTFVLGLPGETKKTIVKTYLFAKELDCDTIQVSIAMPFPGTELYRYFQKKGQLKNLPLINSSGYQAPTVSYPHLSTTQIQKEVERFHLKYYFRPSFILKTIKRALTSSSETKRIIISFWEYAKYLLT